MYLFSYFPIMKIGRKVFQLQVLQHLLINYIKRKPMGDLQSKPMQNNQLRHLQQQYEPFSKGKLMPGDPVYLKLNSIFNKSEYCDKINSRFKKLQRYQVSKRYSETSLQQDRHIYDYRRTNLPCIVQVVYYCIEKQDCECAADAARIVLFTEHVETRLAHFKTSKKTQNNELLSIQYYHSFSLDQGIYVLINALHAYELLSQQFMVNYPSPFSIGITYRGQVKAWINDNWGLNDQNQRKLNKSYLIEEIINIIEQRMQGNFNQILSLTSNYMNYTFATIQELLSRYTLNYQRGKKSLQDRLNYRFFSKDADKSNIFSQKIPIGRHRPNSMHSITYNNNTLQLPTNSITVQEVTKSTQHSKINEKRPLSQQNSKSPNPNIMSNCSRNFSATPKASIQQSPKKTIKFTYQQSPSIRQSPKVSNYQRHSSPVSAFNQTIRLSSPPPTIYSYAIANENKLQNIDMHLTKQSGNNRPLMMPFNVSGDFLSKQTITNLIDMKIKSQNESSNKNSANGRPIVNHSSYKRQIPTQIKTIYNSLEQNQKCFGKISDSITINPFEISAKQQKKVSFDSSLQTLQKKNSIQLNKTSSQNASLSSITQQFKHLLKSDHKIEERQELFNNYQQDQQSQNDKQCQKDCRKTLEQPYDNNPYVNSFYEIKQEDQDVSNSVDQHF